MIVPRLLVAIVSFVVVDVVNVSRGGVHDKRMHVLANECHGKQEIWTKVRNDQDTGLVCGERRHNVGISAPAGQLNIAKSLDVVLLGKFA